MARGPSHHEMNDRRDQGGEHHEVDPTVFQRGGLQGQAIEQQVQAHQRRFAPNVCGRVDLRQHQDDEKAQDRIDEGQP